MHENKPSEQTTQHRHIEQAVHAAVGTLFDNDADLLQSDAAERAIAARLARYLEPHFSGYATDVEYNRHGLDPKRVHLDSYRGKPNLIVPDVIVHQRGHDECNLLVIQIKKTTNREPRTHDRNVLAAMRRDLRYQHALLLDLPAGPQATEHRTRLEWH